MFHGVSKDKKINFSNIPICIEADSESNLILLEKLAIEKDGLFQTVPQFLQDCLQSLLFLLPFTLS